MGGRRALTCKGSGRDGHAGHGCRAGGGDDGGGRKGADYHRPPLKSGHFVVDKFAALHVLDPVTVHIGVEILRVRIGLIERADLHGRR